MKPLLYCRALADTFVETTADFERNTKTGDEIRASVRGLRDFRKEMHLEKKIKCFNTTGTRNPASRFRFNVNQKTERKETEASVLWS